MFGLVAFAQSPFAALGGNSFNVAQSESFVLSEAQTGLADFVGVVNESMTLADLQTGLVDLLVAINEVLTLTEDQTGNADYVVDVVEVTALVDLTSATEDFLLFISELITLSESQDVIASFAGVVDEGMEKNIVEMKEKRIKPPHPPFHPEGKYCERYEYLACC